MKYIFSVLWKNKLCEISAISNARIHILDATIFQVSKHLAHIYPGAGGCAQTAGIKIQLEYDLHN
ncbi:Transposase for insertion sequence element IS231B [Bacillus cereus BGSC 6E1]|nr:Transposase for insertion sequence element IS231B [Bacillus cereus BGSC 6E1]